MADLCVPHLHRLLRASKPVSALFTYGNTQNRWRRYGRLRWFPDGLVALGDAVCSLSPRYGQGMTVAALSVDRLDQELSAHVARRGSLDGISHRCQKSLERLLAVPWQIALMEPAWVTTLAGASPSLPQRLALAFAQRVLKTAFSDIETYIPFMRVAQLLDPPTKMLAPRTLAKIAMGRRNGVAEADAPGIDSA